MDAVISCLQHKQEKEVRWIQILCDQKFKIVGLTIVTPINLIYIYIYKEKIEMLPDYK